MAEKRPMGVRRGNNNRYPVGNDEKTPKKSEVSVRSNDMVKGSKILVFFLTVFAVAMASMVVITLDRRNKTYNELASASTQLATLEAENVRMRSELDAKISLKNVEEYAENVLGMKKMTNSQIEYIKIQNNDIVSVPEKDDNILEKVENFFGKCVEYLKG